MGYFQQQPGPNGEPWWGTVESMMTLETATDVFLSRLPGNYATANDAYSAGVFAQKVQGSSFPDRYARAWDEAHQVLARSRKGAVLVADVTKTNRPDFNEFPIWTTNANSRGGIKPTMFLIHTQEGGRGDRAAEDLAQFCISTQGTKDAVSYHYYISQASDGGVTVVDGVDTDLYSYSVGNANLKAINLCFAGSRAAWTRDQWLKQTNAIDVAAYLAVQDCKKYGMSVKVVPPPYDSGTPGISDHQWVTKVFGWGTHTDVGPGFPWDVFALAVAKYVGDVKPLEPKPPVVKRFPADFTDRELLEDIAVQLRGPGGAGWSQLDGHTLVDAISDVALHLNIPRYSPPKRG